MHICHGIKDIAQKADFVYEEDSWVFETFDRLKALGCMEEGPQEEMNHALELPDAKIKVCCAGVLKRNLAPSSVCKCGDVKLQGLRHRCYLSLHIVCQILIASSKMQITSTYYRCRIFIKRLADHQVNPLSIQIVRRDQGLAPSFKYSSMRNLKWKRERKHRCQIFNLQIAQQTFYLACDMAK
jgi:hypothetical protein